MNKMIKIFALFIFLPFLARAAEGYQAIAPIPGLESASDPASYIASLYNWGIGLVGILAFAQFVISGIIYMTSGVVDQKKAAQGRMTDALIGLGLALASYLFISLINPTVLKLEPLQLEQIVEVTAPTISLPAGTLVTYPVPGRAVTCDESSMNAIENAGYQCQSGGRDASGNNCYTCLQVSGATSLLGSNQYDAQSARSQLSSAGISINNSNECPPGQTTGCTSLSGILKSTVDGVKTIKNSCNCDVTITGGTEAGHAGGAYSHANGWKVDLRFNTQLDNYIYGKIGTSSTPITSSNIQNDKNYCGSDGNTYRKEGDHWDIVVGQCI